MRVTDSHQLSTRSQLEPVTQASDLPARVETDLLVVGAGPYGLGIAAYAKSLGVETAIVGRPMAFWRDRMPAGMYLRSSWDWHYDPHAVHTIEMWLEQTGRTKASITPFSLADYLEFATWFEVVSGLEPIDRQVERLDIRPDGRYEAVFTGDNRLTARHVVLALGFGNFGYVPDELRAVLPDQHVAHTVDFVDFSQAAGKRFAIVGGRQSAYEWAALLHEAGADAVDVIHRHRTPRFAEADWSWTTPVVERIASDPAWYRSLDDAQKRKIAFRLWGEGRGKLEPWLTPRLATPAVRSLPFRTIAGSDLASSGSILLTLDSGDKLEVDQVVLATGYRADARRVPMLAAGNLLDRVEIQNGFPVLDSTFQLSVPGLYATSMLATQEFGSLFAFTVAVRASSRVIGDAVWRTQ
ncbi:MAG: NAD(P)-binding domain-containing protein [Thermomicrobiales bacterium]|nr:NAD(P)-binding domain-containing protein [Thermomicrobiales bacterium]MCO5223275.1 NAD(P)-binding domain-containing protein [Thermomicrobiales bacterium]